VATVAGKVAATFPLCCSPAPEGVVEVALQTTPLGPWADEWDGEVVKEIEGEEADEGGVSGGATA
jgi:hypothetical protein